MSVNIISTNNSSHSCVAIIIRITNIMVFIKCLNNWHKSGTVKKRENRMQLLPFVHVEKGLNLKALEASDQPLWSHTILSCPGSILVS